MQVSVQSIIRCIMAINNAVSIVSERVMFFD